MEINRVNKKSRVNKFDIVRYQLVTELIFIRKEEVIPTDLTLLSVLGVYGSVELGKYCNSAAKVLYGDIMANKSQNVRNRITKLEKRGFVVRDTERRLVSLNPNLGIIREGNILLDYNFIYIEAN